MLDIPPEGYQIDVGNVVYYKFSSRLAYLSQDYMPTLSAQSAFIFPHAVFRMALVATGGYSVNCHVHMSFLRFFFVH